MQVSLTLEQEQFVNKLVESGKYLSASEVVREALTILEERYMVYQARLAQLQKEIDIGIEQLDRGEQVDGETAIKELREGIVTRSEQG
ncbi:MAG: hypothetical protein Fur0025_47870 [Oscillatoriaceae cyanobacterium]